MFERKLVKREARASLKQNYIRAVIVCLAMMVVAGAYSYSTQLDLSAYTGVRTGNDTTFLQHLEGFIRNHSGDGDNYATRGVLAAVRNSAVSAGSLDMGIINLVAELVLGTSTSAVVLLVIGIVVYILYAIFVGSIMAVGEARFFLEAHSYNRTGVHRVLFVFQMRRTRHVAWVMFCYAAAIAASALTVVGGVIVAYQLRMVPYILAENPNVSRKQAFALSRRMMRGNKWKVFLLDMSFLGWLVLSLFSFGLVGILYLNPYTAAANAQLYAALRGSMLAQDPAAFKGVADNQLFHPEHAVSAQGHPGEYPARLSTPEAGGRRWLNLDYHRKYRPANIVLMFFSFMLIGWLWEVLVELFCVGQFVNRGTLVGPWLPLYGFGGVLAVLVLRRFVDKPVVVFFAAIGLCGGLEYFAGWLLETLFGLRWWDYSGYFLHIQGRVCAEGLLVFGFACSLGVYLLAPMLDDWFGRIPKKTKLAVCAVLLTVFLVDVGYSLLNPNTGEHITFSVEAEENAEYYNRLYGEEKASPYRPVHFCTD